MQAEPAHAIQIERTNDNHSVVSLKVPLSDEESELQANFDFGETKGFLGPSVNPAVQEGFAYADGTLIAVNHQPATAA